MSDTIIAAIITGVVSLIVGFISGYGFCIKINVKNIQRAKDNANQIQINGGINAKR